MSNNEAFTEWTRTPEGMRAFSVSHAEAMLMAFKAGAEADREATLLALAGIVGPTDAAAMMREIRKAVSDAK